MRIIALVSAPLGSTDFPDKLMCLVHGKPVIRHTVDTIQSSALFSDVIVVTNDDAIETYLQDNSINVVKTRKSFDNYIERLAEVSVITDADIFVCIPGDMLVLHQSPLEKLLQLFDGTMGKDIQVASIVQKIPQEKQNIKADKNIVKVVLGLRMNALYFSRYPIPYMQNEEMGFACYEHINIVACRKDAMFNFIQWPSSPLERAEQIHTLRFVENGVQIKMLIAQYPYIKLQSIADIATAELFISNTTS